RISPYYFGISSDYDQPDLESYIYTDRPVYRPGQDVSYRAITRYAENGRYEIDDTIETVLVTIYDGDHNTIFEGEEPVSSFGSSHGVYTLAEDAQPGRYQITTPYGKLAFHVMEYRKPEIDLQVATQDGKLAYLAESTQTMEIGARYFFDAPGADLDLSWNLYRNDDSFRIPGYQVGPQNYCWYCGWYERDYFGELIDSGEGVTGADGKFAFDVEILPEDSTSRYTLEATMIDESNFPVSARTILNVHPEKFYIGAKSDTWLGQSGAEINFDLLTVDWDLQPLAKTGLQAQFRQVTWVEDQDSDEGYIPHYETISSTDFNTGSDGVARLAFTPPSPGTYQLDIQSGAAHTQMTVWVRGAGQAVWPRLPSHQMRISADQSAYQPGETASIFIPNAYGTGAQALITVERGTLMRNDVISIDGAGTTYALPLTIEDAPNIYLSVTLIGQDETGEVDFQQGYINIPVAPDEFELNVEVIAVHDGVDVSCPAGTGCPEHLGPGQEVTVDLRVTDAAGEPVEGEFSLAVADLAALSLMDPNAEDIMSAYYDPQPLGIRTGVGLILYRPDPMIIDFPMGGLGGGGGGDLAPPAIRENFPDTAYWHAEIVTDTNGEAQATFTLPDSLTTWHIDTRGLTQDTRIGQAETHVVTSKELLIRPVTPRFMVTGDHLEISAIIHNNADVDLSGELALQAAGFILDDSAEELQNFTIPAGGRSEFSWWGRVDDSDQVVLVFSAAGTDPSGTIYYEDITRPVWGDIPVYHYSARQTFGTAGLLAEGDQRLELVSLPRAFDASAGELNIELAPSLAAAMTAGLDALENYPYQCIEQTVSRFLPNLEAYRAIQSLGLDAPDLAARLERTLDDGLVRLLVRQNRDGGWGWWQDGDSDPYITAYVLFGLIRAQDAGVFVDDQTTIEDAVSYLLAALPAPEMLSSGWQLDRLAFEHFVLAQLGSGALPGADGLFARRDQLSPWASALLALTYEKLLPEDDRIDILVSDLGSTALRSAAGTHWEGRDSWRNMETTTFNSALVIYALAQLDPASASLPEAVRYLMAHRAADGAWASTYESAWAILSLTEFMKGTGELAGDFAFSAELNHSTIAEGQAGGDARLTAVTSSVPVSVLYPDYPNALNIQRADGPGRLYYTAYLNVQRPVEDAAPLNAGISVSRQYCQQGVDDENGCAPLEDAAVGDLVTARLTLTLDQDAYYLMVEDYIPAGAEILNTSLKTSQLGAADYDVRDPFGDGWGWWFFNDPQIYDDHVAWAVDYLPSGTYQLTYTLVLNRPGEFRVIPAHAWQFYFPDVQGSSAGAIFEINE
ncbi:MAG: alpha-2-macroglobulin family protein, partial [Chloroflexota bacterium]